MPRDEYASAVLEIEPRVQRKGSKAVPEDPFTILVLGAFSGAARKNGGAPVEIDLDNFDSVMARFAPHLNPRLAGSPLRLDFRALDDFHPDSLYRRVSLFQDIERAASGGAETTGTGADGNGEYAGLLDRI